MLWKFSFASGSTLESLFTRETPPSVEEVMDETDILSECKAQNQSLISYLSREDSIKSLLQWIISGLDELNEQIAAAEDAALGKAVADSDSYPAFDPSLISGTPVEAPESTESPPLEPARMAEEAMRRAESERDLSSQRQRDEEQGDAQRSRYPSIATEILTSELWVVSETITAYTRTLLVPFFEAVVPASPPAEDAQSIFRRTEIERAKMHYWTTEDEERERKRDVIIGLWCKVMLSLMSKRAPEMLKYFKSMPDTIPRLCALLTYPSIQDMLLCLVQSEEAGFQGTMAWLSEQQLIPLLIRRLSPSYPSSTHSAAGELLKSIVTLCAPTPFNPHGGNLQEQETGHTTRDNRMIREIVSGPNLETLLGYMLDPLELTDSDWKGVNGDGTPSYLDAFVIHPLPNTATATSALTYISSLLVEVIRRNNSDFAEPHLFHTLRNRLMNMQAPRFKPAAKWDADSKVSEEARQEQMEQAVVEWSESMGIVHLGALLQMVVDRFGRLAELVQHPRSMVRSASSATPVPLTYERLRLVELLAELLHSSSMGILNRQTAAAPVYSSEGILSGGLAGLEALGEAIEQDGEESVPEAGHVVMSGADDVGITPARELPVSSAATTDTSSPSSGSVGSVDERMIDELELDQTPTASPATSMVLSPSTPKAPTRDVDEAPPPTPTGPEDEERLKAVRDAALPVTSGSTVEATDASDKPVVGSTAPPSIGSAAPATPIPQPSEVEDKEDDAIIAPGRMLKSAYIEHGVIPTMMDLFFEFPNNDFLHYLVYDVVQQVLSGRLQPGLNRDLVVEMICKGDLVTRVLKTAVQGEIDNANGKRRAAYMGHLNFIAEEIVKFLTRCPEDLLQLIAPSIPQPAWDEYVMGTLTDTKMRESRPLAGGKPMPGMASGTSASGGMDDSDSSDDDAEEDGRRSTLGSFGTFGEPLARTKAGDGFVNRGEEDEDEDRVRAYYWRGGSDRRHVDSSDEDDDDAEWMKPGDDFGGFQAYRSSADDSDDDDAWGSFSSGSTPAHNENAGEGNPFGDDNFDAFDESFTPSVQSRASNQEIRGQPLTPHDWFDREFNEAWGDDQQEDVEGRDDSSDEEGTPSIVIPKMDDEDDLPESTPLGGKGGGSGTGEVPEPSSAPITIPTHSTPDTASPQSTSPSTTAARPAGSPARRAPPPPPPNRRRAGSGAAPPSPSVLLGASQGSSSKLGASALSQDALHEQPEDASADQASSPIKLSKPIDMASERPDRKGSSDAGSIPAGSGTSGLNGSALSTSPTKGDDKLAGSPSAARRRRSSVLNPPDPALIHATNEQEPLGPGVSKDTQITEDGMLKKQTEGGEVVVPMDEVALGVDEAMADDK